MCCRLSIAVARVFALVMACRIILFVTNLSGYAKTVTPSVSAPRQRDQLVPPLQICRGGYIVFAAQKTVAYTDLLGGRDCSIFYQIPSNPHFSHSTNHSSIQVLKRT